MLYQVKDLSPEQKRAAEILLGHSVSEDEAVSIKSLGPTTILPSKLSPEARLQALRALNERFANANRPDVIEDEEDEIVSEAIRSIRPGYRPVDCELSLMRPYWSERIRAVALPDEKC